MKPKVLSKQELGADAQVLGREYYIFGSPAISDGRIYLTTAGGTFCIGTKQPARVETAVAFHVLRHIGSRLGRGGIFFP